ncbi:MAG TPA: carbohydrate ABC transporter permease [Caldilineaceae bacterium]|nr:carbohydrate ABC transporter permease [Caldilineaceae bacterium]
MRQAEPLTATSAPVRIEADGKASSRARYGRLLYHTVFQLILLACSAVMLIPFFWLISTSLKIRGTEFIFPPQWIPRPPVWENYYTAIFASGLPFPRFLLNTTIITLASVVGTLFSTSLAGFGFARMRFPGRNLLFILVLSTMMLPEVVTQIPSYLLFRQFGWIDTFLPLIVPAFLGWSAFSIFLFRQFFLTIPFELDEAARIDGASTRQIYLRVILPLSKPVLSTVAVFTFLDGWNSFLRPLIYLNSLENMTLAVGLRAFQGLRGTEWNLMMAAAAIMMVPVLLVFFLAQRYFIQGIVTSGFGGR